MKEKIDNIFIISDLHFGVHSNNKEWLDIQSDYFMNFLIPHLKKTKRKNPALFVLGDVFDSRQSINIFALNKVIEIFSELSKILPVKIIIGNHDIANKTENDINSLKFLQFIPNIEVFEEPRVISLANGKSCLMMPWRKDGESTNECIKDNDASYLFAHTAINGFYYNRKINIDSTVDYQDIKKFEGVFTGHIHYVQNKYNIYYIGSPYAMNRNDINNTKCLHILETSTGIVEFVENTYSPRFIKMLLSDILSEDLEDVQKIVKNNFVDIINDLPDNLVPMYDKLLDVLHDYRRITFLVGDTISSSEYEDIIIDDTDTHDSYMELDLLILSKKYLTNLEYSDEIKNAAYDKFAELYEKVKSSDLTFNLGN